MDLIFILINLFLTKSMQEPSESRAIRTDQLFVEQLSEKVDLLKVDNDLYE